MKFVRRETEQLDNSDPSNIETAGRICYQTHKPNACLADEETMVAHGCKAGYEGSCNIHTCECHSTWSFAKKMIKSGHHTTLEVFPIYAKILANSLTGANWRDAPLSQKRFFNEVHDGETIYVSANLRAVRNMFKEHPNVFLTKSLVMEIYAKWPALVEDLVSDDMISLIKDPEFSTSRYMISIDDVPYEHHPKLKYATFRFITDRGITHEMVRHRLIGANQESTRYIKYNDIVILVPDVVTDDMLQEVIDSDGQSDSDDKWVQYMCVVYRNAKDTERRYTKLSKKVEDGGLGIPTDYARTILTNGTKAQIVMTCTYEEWSLIFNQRVLGLTGRPHPQIKAIMTEALYTLAEQHECFAEQVKLFESKK